MRIDAFFIPLNELSLERIELFPHSFELLFGNVMMVIWESPFLGVGGCNRSIFPL